MNAVMTPSPYKVETALRLDEALQVMTLNDVRHLPEVVGLLSRRIAELMQAITEKIGAGLTAGDVCNRRPYIVATKDLVSSVAKEMADNKYESALVIDEQDHLAGIFTTIDACRLIHLVLGDQEAG
jgi:acetoin utilization protein AcuB